VCLNKHLNIPVPSQ